MLLSSWCQLVQITLCTIVQRGILKKRCCWGSTLVLFPGILNCYIFLALLGIFFQLYFSIPRYGGVSSRLHNICSLWFPRAPFVLLLCLVFCIWYLRGFFHVLQGMWAISKSINLSEQLFFLNDVLFAPWSLLHDYLSGHKLIHPPSTKRSLR